MLFFGPGDFSHSINARGDLDKPDIERARRMVAEAAPAQRKFAGTVAAPAGAQRLIEKGYRFLNIAADAIALSRGCREAMAEMAPLLKPGGAE